MMHTVELYKNSRSKISWHTSFKRIYDFHSNFSINIHLSNFSPIFPYQFMYVLCQVAQTDEKKTRVKKNYVKDAIIQ